MVAPGSIMAAAASAGTTFRASAEWWMRPCPCMAHHPFHAAPGEYRACRVGRRLQPQSTTRDPDSLTGARGPAGAGGGGRLGSDHRPDPVVEGLADMGNHLWGRPTR